MSTLRVYLRIQAMMFVFGLVGPIFLVVFFAAPPDPEMRWMFWWGLFITAADILIALVVTDSTVRSERAVAAAHARQEAEDG
ncbi:hypothetical protein JDV09_20725 [Mycobacterium sp. Y57]|uniref:hypothetical protein n=1 Tax=Mycolicibacterium xanthum TaxID=2796469 RepID=UPI001C863D05|nr:hypothetical protein [Mycolicibacterium xanthum]MBX7434505.1 hypothetical protein [Mycolicibacterium xanthum]